MRVTFSATLVTLAALSVACEPEAVGEWEAKVGTSSAKSEMSLDAEGEGEATIITEELGEDGFAVYTATFDVEWKDEGGDKYDLDMIAKDPATGQEVTFGVDCDYDADELRCEGTSGPGGWVLNDIDWERAE